MKKSKSKSSIKGTPLKSRESKSDIGGRITIGGTTIGGPSGGLNSRRMR